MEADSNLSVFNCRIMIIFIIIGTNLPTIMVIFIEVAFIFVKVLVTGDNKNPIPNYSSRYHSYFDIDFDDLIEPEPLDL